MSVRHFGTLVRHLFNTWDERTDGSLAARLRPWYKAGLAVTLGQPIRLFASPRCVTSRRSEVTYRVRGQTFVLIPSGSISR